MFKRIIILVTYLVIISFPGFAQQNNGSPQNPNAQITVIKPNGGENWQAGTQHDITWTDDITAHVKIELFKGGVFNSTIVANTFSDGQYPWDIPLGLSPGTDYKIKITSVDDGSVFDFSDGNFSVFAQEITVTKPNGGENWQTGTSHDITWTDNIAAQVKIDLYKGGTFQSTIVASTFSDGQYPWDIPLDLTPAADYKIKITSVNESTIFDFSDADFTIFEQNITVTKPNGGENWQTGTSHDITWTDNIAAQVKIDLYKGGTFQSTIVASTFSDGQYNWDIPLSITPGSDYKVKITSVADGNVFDFSDADFTIFEQNITVTKPNGGENWQTGTSHDITWTDNIAAQVKIDLYKGGTFQSTIVASTFSDGQYNWDIPLSITPGSDYKVKITSVADGNVFDFSDADFTIFEQNITVTKPNGGENWQTGTSHDITWTDNIAAQVKIDLYKGGTFQSTIVASTFSDGQYNWDIPLSITPGSDYKVKITSVADGNVFDFSDADFTIFEQNITVTKPNGGENWQTGTSHDITWTDNIAAQVKIDLYKGGTFQSTIVASTFSDGQYSWNIPLDFPLGNDYKIKITSVENSNISDISDDNFSIFGTELIVTSPNGGENWQAGFTHDITWTDNIAAQVKIDLYNNGTFQSNIVASTFSDGQYSWAIPLDAIPGEQYQIKITSVADENVFDFSDADFTIFEQQITVTKPNGGENWQTGTTHDITWTDNISAQVKIELYNGGNFQSTIIASTFSDGQYPWSIPLDLPPGNSYTIKISSVDETTIFDFSDADFTVFSQQITITSPNGGENWQAGSTHDITWTDNISPHVKIDLYKGGDYLSTLSESTFSDGQFPWEIPMDITPGSDYKIKITSVADENVFDFSDNDFTILGNVITVSKPNGGENWQTGSNHDITWTDNIADQVKIDLYKNDSFQSTIVASTFSDGQYPWSIPSETPLGNDYKIKITSVDNSDVFDFSDDNFSIFGTELIVTAPNGGENWRTGTSHDITWNDNISAQVKIDLYKAGTFQSTIVSSTFSDGQYPWDIPIDTPPDTDYQIKITSVDDENVFDFSDTNFTIFEDEIVVNKPNGGENWQTGSSHDITWTDNISAQVKIDLYKSGAFQSTIVASTFSDGQYPWSIPSGTPLGNDYKIKITSVSNSDVFDFSDENFSIFGTEIIVTKPNGGENWRTGTSHDITWNDNISAQVKIDLYKGGNFQSVIVASTFSDGQYPWLIPDQTPDGTDYQIKITSVADGNVFDFSDADFSIFIPAVEVTKPNGGENWQTGSSHDITWIDNISEKVKIELFKGGSFHSVIKDETFSDGQYPWDIPSDITPGDDYKVKISSVNDETVFDFSDANFTIFPTELTLTKPNGGETWQAGSSRDITWTDNISAKVTIELYKGGNFHSLIKASTFSDGQYPWDIPDDIPPGSDYKVKIFSDDDENVFDFSDADFTILNTTSVEFISNSLPTEYYLYQNYPNPFNPSTKIEFDLPENSNVGLKIYNITGQEVKVILENEVLPPGRFRYDFNAGNLPSGIYFYMLFANSNVSKRTLRKTKKMILLK